MRGGGQLSVRGSLTPCPLSTTAPAAPPGHYSTDLPRAAIACPSCVTSRPRHTRTRPQSSGAVLAALCLFACAGAAVFPLGPHTHVVLATAVG